MMLIAYDKEASMGYSVNNEPHIEDTRKTNKLPFFEYGFWWWWSVSKQDWFIGRSPFV